MCLSIDAKKAEILQNEFERRVNKNPSYSKRAFGRDLGVSHTLLSLIIAKRRQLSRVTAQRLLESRNYLTKNEVDFLKVGFAEQKEREDEIKSDEFLKLIADWTYYAVLNLTKTPDFKWDAEWISKRLGIKESKAVSIMKKLLKLELVEQLESGSWVRKDARISTAKEKVSEAGRKFNKTILKKANESIEESDFSKRDLSSITFTMNPDFIPYAVERIRNFRRELSHELEHLGEQRDVYTLSVQLFPLTK